MARYNPEQQGTIATARRRSARDSRRTQLALLEALGVEANYGSPEQGDRDSEGPLQQRPSQGWGPAAETDAQDIDQFLARARKAESQGFKGTPGQLAQSIQRSAFPGRYDKRADEASGLLGGRVPPHTGGATADPLEAAGAPGAAGGADRDALRQQFASALIAKSRGDQRGADPVALGRELVQARSASNTSPVPPQLKVDVPANAAQSPAVAGALKLVQEAVGTPYVWGGEKPGGFDCSGLLQYAWGKAGVQIPRVTYAQWKTGAPVAKGRLQAGDAVFFRPGASGPEHVGMYIGGGKFVEAPGRGKTVRVSHLKGRGDYMGARRFG